MKMIERGAGIIHKKEYNYWRETGSAFSVREGTYNVPNKTLASGLIIKTVSSFSPLYEGCLLLRNYKKLSTHLSIE